MNNEFQSLKGHLLLDAGGMYGSSFHHSVILMCQHSPQGAFGLVLNQPSNNRVGEILPFTLLKFTASSQFEFDISKCKFMISMSYMFKQPVKLYLVLNFILLNKIFFAFI